MKKLNEYYEQPCYEDVIKELDDDEFEIGQGYMHSSNKKIICKICGSDKWIVGVGSNYTSVKCPACRYELCIHDG